jgi:hypothetical protein
MCPENSGLRQAISELIQRCDEALRHGFEHLESFAFWLAPVWCPLDMALQQSNCSVGFAA